jgi:hypothetical protein
MSAPVKTKPPTVQQQINQVTLDDKRKDQKGDMVVATDSSK